MSTIRFRYEGALYEVEVVRDGDVLTITHEGTAYRVELEPEAAPAAATPAPPPAAPAPAPAPPPRLLRRRPLRHPHRRRPRRGPACCRRR